MPGMCNAVPTQGSYIPGMLTYLDCQAQSLGSQGYQALAASGSVAAVLLTSMITLLIALTGYRMLLGHVPTIRDGVLTFVKIGLVLVLTTSWPAYQILIYDVVLREPAELVANVGGVAALPGAAGGLPGRLDGIDQALQSLAISGVGVLPAGGVSGTSAQNIAPPPFIGFDAWALGWSRVIFLAGSVGSFAIVRIVAGIMLALGPLFLLFLLFDGTRGLVTGWARTLLFCLIGSVGISLALGIELGLMEPWLATLLARRAADVDIAGVPAQLLATSMVFTVALIGILGATAFAAAGLRLPRWSMVGATEPVVRVTPNRPSNQLSDHSVAHESRTRAAAIADAVAIVQRREEMAAGGGIGSSRSTRLATAIQTRSNSELQRAAPTSGPRRRVGTRISARSRVRDRLR